MTRHFPSIPATAVNFYKTPMEIQAWGGTEPTSSSLWCHLRSWSPGRPRCPHAAPQIGEPTPLPPSAPPWADLNTLSIFLVFLSLVTLSPSLHPSTSAHSAYFKGLILSFRRLRESTELPESGTCRFQPRFTTSAGFCMLSC